VKKELSVLALWAMMVLGAAFNWSCQQTTLTPNYPDILIPIVTQVAGLPTNTPTFTPTHTPTVNATATYACASFQATFVGSPCP